MIPISKYIKYQLAHNARRYFNDKMDEDFEWYSKVWVIAERNWKARRKEGVMSVVCECPYCEHLQLKLKKAVL